MEDLHYREYKILLRPERFFNPQQFEVFWKKIAAIAAKHKVEVATNKNAFQRQVREVLFYDTNDHALYKNAFILRRRTFYTDGWPDPAHELTFKYRHPSLDSAAAVDVTPHLQCSAAIKFKEEILPLKDSLGGMRSLYSHNCVLMSPALELNQGVEHIASIFPALGQLHSGATGPKIKLVNNLSVEEVQVNVGTFSFGRDLEAKATIAVWRNRASETPLIGEFAFQTKFNRYDDLHAKAKKRSEDFFVDVQNQEPEWVALGTTKTALVYGLGKAVTVGHE
ncbi:hypothetical protein [Chelatococcus asaccharovorans]|uniref:Uncharacterized protein n=1 Tax=Chelatococcus asaccharovorans TaxID=28210 RepID=A0A2V3U3G2_9HYPH|nr:hypothetical protein [Chelatococcus asaccharovorans]MBS7702822.1 hypothetical protein [Chelatococcus asaccharovorans]PXW57119.1 hypothetical protein C7450_107158 [Chelatococcus asaccharovorans]